MSDQHTRRDEPPVMPGSDSGLAETLRASAPLIAMSAPPARQGPGSRSTTGDQLERAERDVLMALAEGHNVAEIARSLRMAEDMVDAHLAHVLAKLHRQHAARTHGGRSRG